MKAAAKSAPSIPRTVWALGFVSLFMDVSSEIIHALLPLFLTATLGASVALVGMIDGIAEATAAISKVFSGYWSDRMKRRKPLILLGYSLGALSKPLFALSGSPGLVLGARFVDRIGKGMRGAPRDALIADVTPDAIRGRAYGLRQALDTAGAFLGPLAAIGLMFVFADDMRSVFWIAAIPAWVAVVLVLVGVGADRQAAVADKVKSPVKLADMRQLPLAFWIVLGVGVLFTMARFSEAFLVLKASAEGLPLGLAPLVLVAMNAVYALGAYPAGVLSDFAGPRRLLFAGVACLVAADLCLAFASGLWATFAGIGLWGAHMALTQGLLSQLVAAHAPEAVRGSAFGVFNLATGLALLAASAVAGLLWDWGGPFAAFVAGACFAAACVIVLAVLGTRKRG